jgi:hypothetical protein
MEARKFTRYETWLPCVARAEGGPPRDGFIRDMSRGGAAVQLETFENPERFTLSMRFNGELLELSCEPRSTTGVWKAVIVHAAFVDVTAPQRRALGGLIASLAADEAVVRPFGRRGRLRRFRRVA